MSEPIKAGDLVIQIHACCPIYLGRIFVVGKVDRMFFRCNGCSQADKNRLIVFTAHIAGAPVEWVKRIPPLSELEGEKRVEEILWGE